MAVVALEGSSYYFRVNHGIQNNTFFHLIIWLLPLRTNPTTAPSTWDLVVEEFKLNKSLLNCPFWKKKSSLFRLWDHVIQFVLVLVELHMFTSNSKIFDTEKLSLGIGTGQEEGLSKKLESLLSMPIKIGGLGIGNIKEEN